MRRACVIGWPIAHSRSPLIHGWWLQQYGIAGDYTKVAVQPNALADFLENLREQGFAGCNVTVPHKEAALALAAVKEESASAIGAANTLWLEGGCLHAANTDAYGYLSHLRQTFPEWRGAASPTLVLGAGGAARAIVYGLLQAGVPAIDVVNRSHARAESLAGHFGTRVRVPDWEDRARLVREAALIINTTTIGMKGEGSLGLDVTAFRRDAIVSDIVYVPLETQLLRDARAQGLRTLDGLGMLLHQAVPGFEKWFGVRPEVTSELYRLIAADIGAA